MTDYQLTPTEYSKYYASLPKPAGKRGRNAKGNENSRAGINTLIRTNKPLPGVLDIKKIGGRNILRLSKRAYEAYQKIIDAERK